MYKYVLNSVVKISLMFVQYFDYCAIIVVGVFFSWTRYRSSLSRVNIRKSAVGTVDYTLTVLPVKG